MDFGEWGGAAKFCDDLHFTRYSAHIYTKTKSHHLRYDSRSAKTNVTRVARVRTLSAHIYTNIVFPYTTLFRSDCLYLGRAKRASIHVTIVALREIHAVSDAIWFLCKYGRRGRTRELPALR